MGTHNEMITNNTKLKSIIICKINNFIFIFHFVHIAYNDFYSRNYEKEKEVRHGDVRQWVTGLENSSCYRADMWI